MVTITMARRWSGHHQDDTDNEITEGQKCSAYRLPNQVRLSSMGNILLLALLLSSN